MNTKDVFGLGMPKDFSQPSAAQIELSFLRTFPHALQLRARVVGAGGVVAGRAREEERMRLQQGCIRGRTDADRWRRRGGLLHPRRRCTERRTDRARRNCNQPGGLDVQIFFPPFSSARATCRFSEFESAKV